MKTNRKQLAAMTAMASAAFMISIFVPGDVLHAAAPLETATWSASATLPTYEGTVITASSIGMVPETVADVFDVELYKKLNPDVVAALGEDATALYQHFMNFGLAEGRIGSRVLEIAKYRRDNPDLETVFRDDMDAYVRHYFTFGINEGRSNGYSAKVKTKDQKASGFRVQDNGIAEDGNGHILIPWELFETHQMTMEELREKVGESAVILTDAEGNITFVGGTYTDAVVTDEQSAIDALSELYHLMGFPDDCYFLKLADTSNDSNGNTFYRFVSESKEKKNGVAYDSSIILGVNGDGKVLCMSNSGKTSFYVDDQKDYYDVDFYEDAWNKFVDSLGDQFELYEARPTLRYINDNHQYLWVAIVKDKENNVIYEIPIASSKNEDSSISYEWQNSLVTRYAADNYETQELTPYSFDYLIDVDVEEMEFVDSFGNTITLPVHWDEKVGKYYICDPVRKIICVDNMTDTSMVTNYKNVEPLYFDKAEDLKPYMITGIKNLQDVWDRYQIGGIWNETTNIPFIISLNTNASVDNADAGLAMGGVFINLYDNISIADYDTESHELTHAVLRTLTGGIPYKNMTGTIDESYADILGKILQLMAYEALGDAIGNVNTEEWLITNVGEQLSIQNSEELTEDQKTKTARSMTNPESFQMSSQLYGKYFIIAEKDGYEVKKNDKGGVHGNSGILSKIAYRMYKEANLDLDTMFHVWYDTLPLLTPTSSFSTVRGILTYTMQQNGVSAEQIEQVISFFDDADIQENNDAENIVTWDAMTPAAETKVVTLKANEIAEGSSIDLRNVFNVYVDDVSGDTDITFPMYMDAENAYGMIVDSNQKLNQTQVRVEYRPETDNIVVRGTVLNSDVDKGNENVELRYDLKDIGVSVLSRIGDANDETSVEQRDRAAESFGLSWDDYTELFFYIRVPNTSIIPKAYLRRSQDDKDVIDVWFTIESKSATDQSGADEDQNVQSVYVRSDLTDYEIRYEYADQEENSIETDWEKFQKTDALIYYTDLKGQTEEETEETAQESADETAESSEDSEETTEDETTESSEETTEDETAESSEETTEDKTSESSDEATEGDDENSSESQDEATESAEETTKSETSESTQESESDVTGSETTDSAQESNDEADESTDNLADDEIADNEDRASSGDDKED